MRSWYAAPMAERAIEVHREGSRDGRSWSFASLGEALSSLVSLPPSPVTIRLGRGKFREKIRVLRPDLEIVGAGPGKTVLAWDDCARDLLPDGEPMGTFNSYTLYVGAPRVSLRGLSIVNEAGPSFQ